MEDDIFAALDGDSKPFANKVDARLDGDSNKFDYYTNPEVSPSKIDAGNLKTKGKTFVINTYVKDGTVPATDVEKIVNIAKVLVGKGYVFRHTGNDKDALQNKILEIEGIKSETYIPWKKFNPNIEKPTLFKVKGLAYRYAAGLPNFLKFFKARSNPVRAIISREVHAMLGVDLDEPVGMVIMYNVTGDEAPAKRPEFSKLGNTHTYILLAAEANIPVFNIKNEDAVKRIATYIKHQTEE